MSGLTNCLKETPMSTEKKNLEPGLPPLLPETKTVMDTLMAADLIKKALQLAVDQDNLCLQEQIAITETPSSPSVKKSAEKILLNASPNSVF